jgi:hypothetical protein
MFLSLTSNKTLDLEIVTQPSPSEDSLILSKCIRIVDNTHRDGAINLDKFIVIGSPFISWVIVK